MNGLMSTLPPVGRLLREWRRRRRLSQLELSNETSVSTRHLSCIETGRARPSRDMVLHLAERLEVPLRERNVLLLAAGYAPAFGESPVHAPELDAVRDVISGLLEGHEPYPALVVDGEWNLISANTTAAWMAGGADPELLKPPVNVLRLCFHPDGLAPAIMNLADLRGYVLAGVRRELARTASPSLAELYDELVAYRASHRDAPVAKASPRTDRVDGALVPLRMHVDGIDLALISTISTFVRAADATVAGLSIESMFPADTATAAFLRSRRP